MSSDTTRQHDGPLESKYWHFRCNDISEEQYQLLVNLEVEYINIGAIEPNKTREGSHFHTIIKFKRSYGLGSVKKMLLYNRKLNPFDWYMATKYTKTKNLFLMVKYAIKNGSRYENTKISKRDGGVDDESDDDTDDEYPDVSVNESDPEFKPCPEAWYKMERINLNKCTKFQKNQLRMYHGRILNYEWFELNDHNYSLTGNFKTLLANCQHNPNLQNLLRLCNWFIYGAPGLGKSSLIDFLFPGHYRKIKTNEKVDSHSNYLERHKVWYFDEMDSISDFDQCLGNFGEFKTITDVYPFPTRCNYGNQQIMVRPNRFVITSNFSFSTILSTDNKYGKKVQHMETLGSAFKRRFRIMTIDQAHEYTGTYFCQERKRTFYKYGVSHFDTETDTIVYEDGFDESEVAYNQYDLSNEN